ncbi:MAG: RNA polymerase sigma-70 factor [Cellulophaga sp.]
MKKLDLNNEQILISLRNGDKKAFKIIFDMYQKKLFYFVFSITKSEYATEEILQEVFIKIWTLRETIDPTQSFSSFIHTIARNLTYNHLRSVASRKSLKMELWKNLTYLSEQTKNSILYNEYQAIVDDIVSSLPKQKRSIFILSKKEGKSNQEIADLLGITPKTVKNHLWKTLQTIKIQLQPHIDTITTVLILISATLLAL